MFFCVQQHAHQIVTYAYCQLRSQPCTTTVTAHSGNCLYLHCLHPLQFDRSELEVARYLLATGIIFYLALWPVTWKRIVASVNADYRNRFAIAIWACCPAALLQLLLRCKQLKGQVRLRAMASWLAWD